jgi:hypothetical protein
MPLRKRKPPRGGKKEPALRHLQSTTTLNRFQKKIYLSLDGLYPLFETLVLFVLTAA